ncbi:MAG: phosphoribosylformylglycinamidine synthase I [Thermoplasmata archaeon]
MAPRRALRVGILTIEGTNCDEELALALRALGCRVEILHLKQLYDPSIPRRDRRQLSDYGLLWIPGGFSAGDYVRAGAIFAARIRASIGPSLEEYVRSGALLGGICNGFQVLTELGLLPGRPDGRLGRPDAALMPNDSHRFECRPTWVAWEGGGFGPLRDWPVGRRLYLPSAHGEGKLVLAEPAERRRAELAERGQILFRWVAPDGGPAAYPWNPNGSAGAIAGLTNPGGTVFGLMPHPERSFFPTQIPGWTRRGTRDAEPGGADFLEAVVRFAEARA